MGRIRKQRLMKYKNRNNKVDESFQTDNLESSVVVMKEEEEVLVEVGVQ